jgi:hypothetical protein
MIQLIPLNMTPNTVRKIAKKKKEMYFEDFVLHDIANLNGWFPDIFHIIKKKTRLLILIGFML